jgi:hypothetical protein
MDLRPLLDAQLHRLNSIIPPQILVPVIIGVLTLIAAAAAAISIKSVEKDIYDAPEKHVLKIEEVNC